MKKMIKTLGAVTLAVLLLTCSVSAMTKSPFADSSATITKISVRAWFNSGYKTTDSDTKYGVKKNAYIRQCWVRIQEGSYDQKRFSGSYSKDQKAQGSASLSCVNNPFQVSTATWGWKYN